MMSNLAKDMPTIRKLGIEALTEKLGPIGMAEFIRQFDSGYGSYTDERKDYLDNITLEDIIKSIEEK